MELEVDRTIDLPPTAKTREPHEHEPCQFHTFSCKQWQYSENLGHRQPQSTQTRIPDRGNWMYTIPKIHCLDHQQKKNIPSMVTPRQQPRFRLHNTMADVHVAIKQKTDPNHPTTTCNPHPVWPITSAETTVTATRHQYSNSPNRCHSRRGVPIGITIAPNKIGSILRGQQQHHQRSDTIHPINYLHLGGSTQDMESPPPPIDRNPTHRLGHHPSSHHIQLPSMQYHMAPPFHDSRQRQTGSVSTSTTTPTRPDKRIPETYSPKGT